MAMKTVGIKNLKAHLSEYVRMVKAGETVWISERDEIVAELRPARRPRADTSTLEDVLESLAQGSEVTRAAVSKRDWTFRTRGLGLPAGSAQEILSELRDDRLG